MPNFFDLYHHCNNRGGINSITRPRFRTSFIMRQSMKAYLIGFRNLYFPRVGSQTDNVYKRKDVIHYQPNSPITEGVFALGFTINNLTDFSK